MADARDEVSTDTRRELLDAALELADQCAATTASIVKSGFDVSKKADDSLVTTADVETERAFRKSVQERFPDMAVLGEELGASAQSTDFRWIIDPIDGTAEFARHLPVLFSRCIDADHDGSLTHAGKRVVNFCLIETIQQLSQLRQVAHLSTPV